MGFIVVAMTGLCGSTTSAMVSEIILVGCEPAPTTSDWDRMEDSDHGGLHGRVQDYG